MTAVARGTGYHPVPAGVREDYWHMHPKAPRAGQASPDADLVRFAPPIDDQGQVGQCTGEAVTCGTTTTLRAAGADVAGFLDAQSPYRMARALDRAAEYPWADGKPPALQDTGADPNQVFRALNKYGCRTTLDGYGFDGPCPELTAAYETHANDEPDLLELEEDDTFRAVGQQRVLSVGQQRIDDVRAALAAGFAVTMSVYASDARFQDYVGGVMPPAPDWVGCNHLVCVVGDYTDATGATVLLVQNSWSKAWGEAGYFRASSGILLQSDCVHVASVRKGS